MEPQDLLEQRITFVNGEYLPANQARISPLDRGFLFGDGIYEVIPYYFHKFFHLKPHIERLNQSLDGIRMNPPLTLDEWESILKTLADKNKDPHQWIYVQVTRGTSPKRSHEFPSPIKPGLFAISYPNTLPSKEDASKGLKILGVEDIRWKYCHIKTISRIAYVLMHQQAIDAGCDEALIFHNNTAVEGSISNVFIVSKGVLITPPTSHLLLRGITRDCILSLAKKNDIPWREETLKEQDILNADEMWISSSTRGVQPVTEFNGRPIGHGKGGPLWERMFDLMLNEIKNNA